MSFWQFLQLNWSELLLLVRQHVVLVFIAILIAVVIGVPTGVLLTRHRSLRGPVLGIANVMQTIPSLALFGFLIPLPFIGGIGTRTALVALVLYSLLPIIRNTVTGILGVDPNVREAAVAMGMTGSQVLRQVELPLAMAVIASLCAALARSSAITPTDQSPLPIASGVSPSMMNPRPSSDTEP